MLQLPLHASEILSDSEKYRMLEKGIVFTKIWVRNIVLVLPKIWCLAGLLEHIQISKDSFTQHLIVIMHCP